MTPKRILVLMSDTGGGHRAAAEAICSAAQQRYPDEFQFEFVDVFRDHTPIPFRFAPELYPLWVNYLAWSWRLTYSMTDSLWGSRFAVGFFNLYWRRGLKRLAKQHRPDLILAVHSIISRPSLKVLREIHPDTPSMTVVTDLVSTHAFWFDTGLDRCLVPTQTAYERGLSLGMRADQMHITGLPVHPDFAEGLAEKSSARRDLQLDAELPAILLVSGGDGMGPLFKIAEEIDNRRFNCQLVIVAGRNKRLQDQLNAHEWHQPTRIFGFVDFMPKLMAAVDVLVSKAGPATITEACMAGLPIIISGYVPGQEDGNIAHVVEHDIGVFAPTPKAIADTIAAWLSAGDNELKRRSARAKAISRPDAVWEIVDELHHLAYSETRLADANAQSPAQLSSGRSSAENP